jgi:hypothetical protein
MGREITLLFYFKWVLDNDLNGSLETKIKEPVYDKNGRTNWTFFGLFLYVVILRVYL